MCLAIKALTRESGTYSTEEIFHLFKSVFKRLYVALWRSSFLCDFDIGAIVRISDAVCAFAVVHSWTIATDLDPRVEDS